MSILNSLLTALEYNGYGWHIKRILKALGEYNSEEFYTAQYPQLSFSHVEEYLSEDVDSPDRILWSTLVCEYGCYGTSPRFGWIEETKKCEKEMMIWLKESCFECQNVRDCKSICERKLNDKQ